MTEAQTSWQAVQQEALRRIQTRIWKPGELIPNEVDLATEFGCARATVNRALRELAGAGILDRRRKAGTRVALHPVRKATFDIPVLQHEVEARGQTHGYALVGAVTARAPLHLRSRMNLPDDAPLLHVRALHLADGNPYAYEDRWINTDAVPDILSVDLARISANEWLVQNAPYTGGEMALSAIPADEEAAAILRSAPAAPLFLVERTTWNDMVPITTVRLLYPPGHRLRTAL